MGEAGTFRRDAGVDPENPHRDLLEFQGLRSGQTVLSGDDNAVAALPGIAGNPQGFEPLGVEGADDLRCPLRIVVLNPRDIAAPKPLWPGGYQRG